MLCVRVKFSSISDWPHCRVQSNIFADGRSRRVGDFPGNSAPEARANPPGEVRGDFTLLRCGERQHLVGNLMVKDLLEPQEFHTNDGGVGDPMVPTDHDIDGILARQPVIAKYERIGASRLYFTASEGCNRGDEKRSQIVAALAAEIQADGPGEAAERLGQAG